MTAATLARRLAELERRQPAVLQQSRGMPGVYAALDSAAAAEARTPAEDAAHLARLTPVQRAEELRCRETYRAIQTL